MLSRVVKAIILANDAVRKSKLLLRFSNKGVIYCLSCKCYFRYYNNHLTASSRTTWVSRYQKGKTNLYFTEARE